VLKTISPDRSPSAPKDRPSNILPSSKINLELFIKKSILNVAPLGEPNLTAIFKKANARLEKKRVFQHQFLVFIQD
jgi:hypothetical protein